MKFYFKENTCWLKIHNPHDRLWHAVLRVNKHTVVKEYRDTLYSQPVIFRFDLSGGADSFYLTVFDPHNKEFLIFEIYRGYKGKWTHGLRYHITNAY